MIAGRRRVGLLLGLAAAATAIAGCESTQDESARLKAEGGKLIASEKGLVVNTTNASVRVLRSGVVKDENGIAIAIVLRNDSAQPAVNVPIAIDVRDARRRTIYRNNLPGLDPSLTTIGSMPPHSEVTWVDDQVTATETPASVVARVGDARARDDGALPRIEVGPPRINDDPVSGLELVGTVTNRSTSDQTRLVIVGVAWKGARLLAAGRSVIDRLTTTKPARYHILPIGRVGKAAVSVAAIPTVTTSRTRREG